MSRCMPGPGIALWMGRRWSRSLGTFMVVGLRVRLRERLKEVRGRGAGEMGESRGYGVGVWV